LARIFIQRNLTAFTPLAFPHRQRALETLGVPDVYVIVPVHRVIADLEARLAELTEEAE
jgi:hypothetical protein